MNKVRSLNVDDISNEEYSSLIDKLFLIRETRASAFRHAIAAAKYNCGPPRLCMCPDKCHSAGRVSTVSLGDIAPMVWCGFGGGVTAFLKPVSVF